MKQSERFLMVLAGMAIGASLMTRKADDAALGRALRQLAESGEAPMLTHSEHGWYVHLRCGRELVFRSTPEAAVEDAVEATR